MNTFENLNAQVVEIGTKIGNQLFVDKDLDGLRLLRQDVVDLFDITVGIIEGKDDYPTWHAKFVKANVENRFHDLDTTGTFTHCVNEILKLDASVYYNNAIIPLIAGGTEVVIAERQKALAMLDFVIEMIEAEQAQV